MQAQRAAQLRGLAECGSFAKHQLDGIARHDVNH
jgi:hypothetical protein